MPSPRTGRRRPSAALIGLFGALGVAATAATAAVVRAQDAAAPATLDLELVLAVDCSYSVSDGEYRLQMSGLAAAFRDPEVHRALVAAARRGGVAVSVVHWSGAGQHRQALDWTRVDDRSAAAALAARIEAAPRAVPEGPTALGDAVDFSVRLLAGNGIEAARRVVDVSGDGRRNTGAEPSAARRRALAAGVTAVNGLAILNEDATLDAYYRERVIGGDGAFMLAADDYDDFARAMRLKLLAEIGNSPLAARPDRSRPAAALAASDAAPAAVRRETSGARRGGSGAGGAEPTKAELDEQARDRKIPGRSKTSKDDLRRALAG